MNAPPLHPSLVRYGPACAATALIVLLSLLPAYAFHGIESSLPPVPGFDKLVHCAMYAGLTATYLHAVPLGKRAALKTLLTISLLSILLGIAMELGQGWLTTTRHLDPYDALANAAGTFASAIAARVWLRRTARATTPFERAKK